MPTRLVYIYSVVHILFVFSASCEKSQSLYAIQRDFLNRKNRDAKVYVDRVKQYYKSLPTPMFIHEKVDSLVQIFIESQEIKNPPTWNDCLHNNDQIDFKLFQLVSEICAAKIRGDDSSFVHSLSLSQQLANKLTAESGNSFWQNWLPTVRRFNKQEALAYLKAQQADAKSRLLYHEPETIREAELYTAASLQYKNRIFAPRLDLDISQRIVVFLQRYYSFYELAIAIAAVEIQKAEENHYTIRVVGLQYNAAMASYNDGAIDESILEFNKVLETVKDHKEPPYVDYKIKSLMGLTAANFDAGNYDEVERLCEFLDQESLSADDQINLNVYRGLAAMQLADYDTAESQFELVYFKAECLKNYELVVNSLINHGDLKLNLDELDMAIAYFDSAKQILSRRGASLPIRQKVNVLSNMVEAHALCGKRSEYQTNLEALAKITRQLENPPLIGRNLANVGNFYWQSKNLNKAELHFREARDIFKKCGLNRQYLETTIEWSKCLLGLQDFKKAAAAIATVKERSLEDSCAIGIVEYYGLASELQFALGNIDKANEYADELWEKIDKLQSHLYSNKNITLFNQRLYHYLKQTALYEIKRHQKNAAFLKMESAKAWGQKKSQARLRSQNFSPTDQPSIEQMQVNLPENAALVSFLTAADSLYAFCLLKDDLRLVKIEIGYDELNEFCSSLTNTVYRSSYALMTGNHSLIERDYKKCFKELNIISKKLLTAEIRGILDSIDIIYMVPDEILWQLPFCSLIYDQADKMRFLIEKKEIVYLPSASFIVKYTPDGMADENFSKCRILCCVDKNYPESNAICHYITNKFPQAEYLRVNSASFQKDDVLAVLGQNFDIYIFFGHSQSNTINPDLSYITTSVFNVNDSSTQDIKLTLSDLKKISWRKTKLIILMGCGTARGKLYKGSGLAGLQDGLLTLGAPQVLATLWEIDSYNAAQQFERIVESISKGNSLEKALRESQVALIQSLKNSATTYPHPFIWASYRVAKTKII